MQISQTKKKKQMKDILKIFNKVEVNTHFFNVIKQIPRYAKILKQLCTSKRKLKINKKIRVNKNALAFIQKLC